MTLSPVPNIKLLSSPSSYCSTWCLKNPAPRASFRPPLLSSISTNTHSVSSPLSSVSTNTSYYSRLLSRVYHMLAAMESTKTNAKEAMPVQDHAKSDNHSNWVGRQSGLEKNEMQGFKEWGRQDALKALRDEFWEKHPGRDEADTPDNNPNSTINADHPDYYMYTRLETLINAHYDEIYDEIEAGIIRDAQNGDPDNEAGAWTGTETSLIRKTVDGLKDAVAAVRAGGYKMVDGHHVDWKELLPSQEEIMLCRFVDPYGARHATIFRLIAIMGVEWMGSI